MRLAAVVARALASGACDPPEDPALSLPDRWLVRAVEAQGESGELRLENGARVRLLDAGEESVDVVVETGMHAGMSARVPTSALWRPRRGS